LAPVIGFLDDASEAIAAESIALPPLVDYCDQPFLAVIFVLADVAVGLAATTDFA